MTARIARRGCHVVAAHGEPFARPDPGRPGRAGGRFVHWLAWGIGFGTVGYRGPCPPRGRGRHRYQFRLHAVAEEVGLAPGAGVAELEQALEGKVLAVAELVGIYQR